MQGSHRVMGREWGEGPGGHRGVARGSWGRGQGVTGERPGARDKTMHPVRLAEGVNNGGKK